MSHEMHGRFLPTVLLASFVVLTSVGAEGQVPLPFYDVANASDKVNTLTLWTDIGPRRGSRESLGGHVVVNAGRVNFRGAGGILFSGDVSNAGFVGAGLGIDFYARSPSRPTATPAVGVWRVGTDESGGISLTQWDVPLGVGFSWYLPAVVINVEPWLQPRVHFRSRTTNGGSSTSGQKVGGALSGGITLTHFKGPGFHMAFDLLRIGDEVTGASATEWVLAFGLHWKFLLSVRD